MPQVFFTYTEAELRTLIERDLRERGYELDSVSFYQGQPDRPHGSNYVYANATTKREKTGT